MAPRARPGHINSVSDRSQELAAALHPRYQLERQLGQGGMATVYLARDLKHDRPVALKVLREDIAALMGSERFKREIRLAARLQHPHICGVHDSGEHAGILWFTMPYVEGESVEARLTRTGRLPAEEALGIASEAALGLAAAHAQGVIHRDIKPANLLLSADGSTLVADFGIARALGGSGTAPGSAPLTETGYSPGTPAYMSPEQLAGGREVDARSDVFSLGLVLLEMLTGERPGGASGLPAVLALSAEQRAPLAATPHDWPPGTGAVVRRAIAMDPAERYPSMEAFRRAIEALRRQPTRAVGRWPLLAAVLVGVAVLGVAVGLLVRGGDDGHLTRLAVLPLADQSPAQDQAWFSDGLAEELTTQLGRVPALQVAARGSAFQFRGPGVDVREVGRRLGVGSVLTGSVRKQDARLRVSVQLVDAREGRELWSETYDRTSADVFAVQSEIAHAVTRALEIRLGAQADSSVSRGATRDLAAYDDFLKGRFALNQRTEATLPEAVRSFSAAVARDSTFSRAWAGLAEAMLVMPLFTNTPPDSAWPIARDAARRAIALDPGLAEAHTALGYGTMLYEWDWPAAERAFKEAIAADPSYPTAHHWYGDFLAGRGRFEEALVQMQQAHDLDPLSRIIAVELAWALHLLRREAEADSVLDEVVRLDPNFAHGYLIRGLVRLGQNRPAEAAAQFRRSIALGGPNINAQGGLVAAEALQGNRPAARAMLDTMLAVSRREFVAPFFFVIAYGHLGDMDQAFAWLDRGIRERDPFLPEGFFDVLCDPLKQDPRYARVAALLRGAGPEM